MHTCSHVMCYRGLHFHLPCASPRVDLNVIPFLERQFICFFLVSLCPSALAVTFSCALGLRNPSAFFTCCTSCTYVTCCFFHTGVFVPWGCGFCLLFSTMPYVPQHCHCHALGLLFGLLLSLAITSKVIAHIIISGL